MPADVVLGVGEGQLSLTFPGEGGGALRLTFFFLGRRGVQNTNRLTPSVEIWSDEVLGASRQTVKVRQLATLAMVGLEKRTELTATPQQQDDRVQSAVGSMSKAFCAEFDSSASVQEKEDDASNSSSLKILFLSFMHVSHAKKHPEDQNAFCHRPASSGTAVLDGTQLLESAKRGGTRWAWQRIEGASGLGTGERGQALGGEDETVSEEALVPPAKDLVCHLTYFSQMKYHVA